MFRSNEQRRAASRRLHLAPPRERAILLAVRPDSPRETHATTRARMRSSLSPLFLASKRLRLDRRASQVSRSRWPPHRAQRRTRLHLGIGGPPTAYPRRRLPEPMPASV